jgi:glycosyltransferase involved in cell wall biosynthesis
MEVTFLTFNYGTAGRYVNGPGMCLHNLVTYLRDSAYTVNVFSVLDSPYEGVAGVSSINRVKKAIDRSDIVHHWSGLNKSFSSLCAYAKKKNKAVLIGPNLIDTVDFKNEQEYLSRTKYDKILVPNYRLKYKVAKEHGIPLNKIEKFVVGPDAELWKPVLDEEREEFILWKGNGKQYVKDVKFGIEIAKRLKGKYKFEFMGHPKPYVYEAHIEKAKKAKLFICTSLSETMGLALWEQHMAGVPSVVHPKIYMPGINYTTGIITNRTIEDYVQAIDEIMSDDVLHKKLSYGASRLAHKAFSDVEIVQEYNIIMYGVINAS